MREEISGGSCRRLFRTHSASASMFPTSAFRIDLHSSSTSAKAESCSNAAKNFRLLRRKLMRDWMSSVSTCENAVKISSSLIPRSVDSIFDLRAPSFSNTPIPSNQLVLSEASESCGNMKANNFLMTKLLISACLHLGWIGEKGPKKSNQLVALWMTLTALVKNTTMPIKYGKACTAIWGPM